MSLKKFISLALTAISLDQTTKALVVHYLENKSPIELAPFLNFTYIENTGISFGLFPNAGNLTFLAVNSLFILALILYYNHYRKLPSSKPFHWALMLLIAGGLGNIVDRISRGFVIDFIDFKIWPVFNAADSFITIGAILYASHSFFSRTPNS